MPGFWMILLREAVDVELLVAEREAPDVGIVLLLSAIRFLSSVRGPWLQRQAALEAGADVGEGSERLLVQAELFARPAAPGPPPACARPPRDRACVGRARRGAVRSTLAVRQTRRACFLVVRPLRGRRDGERRRTDRTWPLA